MKKLLAAFLFISLAVGVVWWIHSRASASSSETTGARSQMTPLHYGAKVLGVPPEALEATASLFGPPETKEDAQKGLLRTWRVKRSFKPPEGQTVPRRVSVLSRYAALASWDPPAGAKAARPPHGKRGADELARGFLRDRGFPVESWVITTSKSHTENHGGQAEDVEFEFENRDPAYMTATVTVDLDYWYVRHVTILATPKAVYPSREPVISMKEAKSLVLAAIEARGMGGYDPRIEHEQLVLDLRGLDPGHPVYVFGVALRKPPGGGEIPYEWGEFWFVDGWTKKVWTTSGRDANGHNN